MTRNCGALQTTILRNPETGAVIPGTGGLRRMRWGLDQSGKGGGLRVIYYLVTADARCLLLHVSQACAGRPCAG